MKQWFLVLLSFILAGAFSSVNAQQGTAAWSRRAGANLSDQASAVATDASGNVYVTGSFSGINASFGNGITVNSSGSEDIFLAKYSADGNTQWVRVAGASGTGADRGRSVTVDAAGNVYVAGFFEGTAIFPNTQLVSNGLRDGFIAKYDANGNFQWARRVGGVGRDEAYDVATDASGNVYVVGQYQNTINVGGTTLTSNGDFDFFVARWDGNGNPVWAIGGGGATPDGATAVATDGNDVYVTGNFDGIASFEANNPAFQRTSQGSFDAYLASYSAATGKANWVNIGGGTAADYGNDVVVERGTGAVYTTGRFVGQGRFFGIQPTPVLITSVNSSDDVYLNKYDRSGNILWSKGAGSTNSDFGNALALDNGGNVYVVGQFQNTITFAPGFTATSRGNYDLFVARYNVNGDVDFAKGYGTASLDAATGVNLFGSAGYVVGFYNGSIQFDANPLLTSPGLSDVFVARIGFDVTPCNLVSPSVTADPAVNCSQTLRSSAPFTPSFIQWRRNGLNIGGANNNVLVASEAGAYTVVYTQGNCTSESAPSNVSVANNLRVSTSATALSITAGQSTTLSVNVTGNSGNVTVVWRDGFGNQVGTGTSVTVSPLASTSYTATVSDQSGCQAVGSVTISVISAGNCRTSGDVVIGIVQGRDNVTQTPLRAEVCIGQGSAFFSNFADNDPNFAYEWLYDASANGSFTRIVGRTATLPSIDIEGFYRLRVRHLSQTQCPDAVSATTLELKKFALPHTLVITSSQDGNPNANPVTLTANPDGGTRFSNNDYRYRWSPVNGIIGSNLTRTITVNPNVATSYTCEVIDSIGCSISRTRSVVPNVPGISIVGPNTICVGETAGYSATLGGELAPTQTVRWYRNNTIVTGFNGSFNFSTTVGGTIFAEVFDSRDSRFTRSNTITLTVVNAIPANAGGNRTICFGQSTVLGTNSVNNANYSWVGSDGSAFSGPRPTVAPQVTTTYTLTVQNQNCPATTSVVTVNVAPALDIVANGPTSFCEPGSVALMVVNPVTGTNYTWRRDGIFVGNGTMFSASVTGNYTVSNEACESNGIGVNAFTRRNLPIPKIRQFGSATLAICDNNAVRLWTDRLSDTYNYAWFKDGMVIQGANDTTYLATEPGVYHVERSESVTGDICSFSKSEGVFITKSNVAPPKVWSDGDRIICRESNVCLKFKATTGHPNKKIMWDWSPKVTVVSTKMTNDSLELCVKPLQDQVYTVTVKDDFNCTAVTQATVSLKAIPRPGISGQTICQNGSFMLSRPFEGNYTFWKLWRRVVNTNTNTDWQTNMDIAGSPWVQYANVNQDEYKIVAGTNIGSNQREQFAFEASVEGCGMEYSDILTLDVITCPTISGVSGTAYCDNAPPASRTFTASGVSSGSYGGRTGGTPLLTWTVNGTVVADRTSNQSITVNRANLPQGAGDYEVSVTVVNNISQTATATAGIKVVPAHGTPLTLARDGESIAICNGQTARLLLSPIDTANYTYRLNNNTTIADPFNITVSPTGNTTYTITAICRFPTTCGSVTSNSVTVNVNPLPVVTAFTKAICYGDKIELWSNNTVPANGSFTWELVDTVSATANVLATINTNRVGTSSSPNVIMVDMPGYPAQALAESATYRLTFTNANGCTNAAYAVVTFVKAGPEARATADKPMICAGDTTFLTGMNAGMLSRQIANPNKYSPNFEFIYYRWNGPATMNNPTGLLDNGFLERNGNVQPGQTNNRTIRPLRVNPMQTTTYTLTLTNGYNECVSTCEVTVKVGPRLVATVRNVTGNENLCAGDVILEAISNTNSQGQSQGVSYQWYTDIDGDDMWVMIPGATGKTFRPTTGGRYNVKVWLAGMEGCYDYGDRWHTIYGVDGDVAQSNDLVTVLRDGDAIIQKEPAIICAGQQIELEARYIFGAAYQWYSVTGPKGKEQYTMLSGAMNRQYVTGTSGRYVVNVIAGCDTCPDVCEIWSQVCPVVVLQELKPTVMHNGQIELCEGNHVELYTQGSETQYAYQWYRDGMMIDGETKNRIITRTDGRYSVEVRPRFTPTNSRYCRAWSVNEVDVKRCSTGFCPKPISVRGVLNPDSPTTGQIRWDQPLNTSLYNLTGTYYVTLTQGNTTIFADRVVRNQLWLNVDNLTPNTEYNVCVRTECSKPTRMSDSECAGFRTFSGVACNNPANVSVTGTTATTANISWASVAGAIRYHVAFRQVGTTTWSAESPAASTSASITGLSDGVSYEYYVRSICSDNPSVGGAMPGTQGSFTTGGEACPDLNQPNGVRPVNRGTTFLDIEWDEVANPNGALAGYQIDLYIDQSNTFVRSELVDLNTTSFRLDNLIPNTVYRFWVRPRCTNGVKDQLIDNTGQTLPAGNGSVNDNTPIAIFIQDLGATDATIGWTTLTNATSYDLRWRVANSGTDLGTTTTANTVHTITGLTEGVTYEVSVRPNITGVATTFSAPLFFTTRTNGICDRPRIADIQYACLNGSHEIIISWLDPAAEPGVGYQLNWRRRGDTEWIVSEPSLPTSRQDTIGGMFTDNEVFEVNLVAICDAATRDSVSALIFTRNCSGGRIANNVANGIESYNIYPNPTNGAYNVSFSTKEASNVTLRMVDATGRVVYNTVYGAVAGENIIPVNANVSAGIYMLQIQTGNSIHTAKIVVE